LVLHRLTSKLGPVLYGVTLLLGLALGVPLGIAFEMGNPGALRHTLAGPGASSPSPPGTPPSSSDRPSLDLFWEAWKTINDEFINRSALTERNLTYGAIRGMVQALGDPNTLFQTPEERQTEMSGFSGRFQGIGTQIETRDDRIVITAPIEGSPAARAGVQPGDVMLQVDGQDIAGLNVQQVAAKVRGPKGTSVTLLLLRGADRVELTIERDDIPNISARGSMLEPGIGLIRIGTFTERSDDEVGAAVDSLKRDGAQGLVLDVRGNPGGLLEPAVGAASWLTDASPIVYQEKAAGQRYAYERRADHTAITWPIVVLVDRGSASASEVIAAALRDEGRGILVGTRTYGKGTVQYLHELSDGAGLRVTAARWISPGGTELNGSGLEPDIQVDGARTETDDPAMSMALQRLRDVLHAGGA
jgi:carboxyl-terminal processing protease